jgi:hypothetical protein
MPMQFAPVEDHPVPGAGGAAERRADGRQAQVPDQDRVEAPLLHDATAGAIAAEPPRGGPAPVDLERLQRVERGITTGCRCQYREVAVEAVAELVVVVGDAAGRGREELASDQEGVHDAVRVAWCAPARPPARSEAPCTGRMALRLMLDLSSAPRG